MLKGVGTALLWLYAGGAALTGAYLVFPFGPKLLRRMFKKRQRTGVDWALLPVEVLVTLLTGVFFVGAAGAVWPVTILYLRRDKASQEEEQSRIRSREFTALLEEVRNSKRDLMEEPGAE